MTRRLMGAALALVFIGACSSGTPTSALDEDDLRFVDALEARFAERDEVPFTDVESRCLAEEFVRALGGADALSAEGGTPEDLQRSGFTDLGIEIDGSAAEGVGSAFGSCDVDVAGLLVDGLGPEAPDGVGDCLRARLDGEALGALARVYLQVPTGPTQAAAIEDLNGCFGG